MKAFRRNRIVPDIITRSPKKAVYVEYKESDKEVDFGNELTPTEVKEIPEVQFDADPHSFYTLIMTDPDVPSRKNPVSREWHHWLVVNIPGGNVAKGDTLTDYLGSAPPNGSGLHRYVFLVFKQPGKLTFTETYKSNRDGRRGRFSTKKFAAKYRLGQPIAGNFYQAKWDESVPAISRQFSPGI